MFKSYLEYLKESVDNNQLKMLYDEYNTKYFDNMLPFIPVVLYNSKVCGGVAVAHHKNNNIVSIDCIKISKYLTDDIDVLKKILIHEMIHIKLYTKNIIRDIGSVHGTYFKEECLRLKSLYNLDIPLDAEDKYFDYKNLLIYKDVLVKFMDDKYSISVFKNGEISNNLDKFIENFFQCLNII